MTDLNFLMRLHAIVDSLASTDADDGSADDPDVLELKRILIARIAGLEAGEKKKQAGAAFQAKRSLELVA